MNGLKMFSRRSISFFLFVILLCSVSVQGQSFESPFRDETQASGRHFTYLSQYYDFGILKQDYSLYAWTTVNEFESIEQTYTYDDGLWQAGTITYYSHGRETYDETLLGDFSVLNYITEETLPPAAITVGETYQTTETQEDWTSVIDHYQSIEETVTNETLVGIGLVELEIGTFPAYLFNSVLKISTIGWPDSVQTPSIHYRKFKGYYIPELGWVKTATGNEVEYGYWTELTAINFDFDPEPLPILDSDNPVWNMLGYTWDSGNGWQYSFEFGSVYTGQWPTVYLDSSQTWLYLTGDRHSLWAWDYAGNRWIWTSQAFWPWVYDVTVGGWRYGL